MLRMVLIILAIYFLVRFLGRLLKPYLSDQSPQRNTSNRPRKEGEVTIEYTDKSKKRKKTDTGDGDYIDFEELD